MGRMMDVIFSLFPKFYKHLDADRLAAVVRETGLDTTNVIIRDGFWVTAAGLATELPAFLRILRAEGLNVTFASAGFPAAQLIADPTPLAILAGNGITEFRLGYFRETKDGPRSSLGAARKQLEQLIPLCERHRIRAVYQLHHDTLVSNPSAVWHIVQGLPARWLGIELDPGNQGFEGFEDWGRSTRLLNEYLAAAGIKDTALNRDIQAAGNPDKGWRRTWVPIDEGVTNWHDFVRSLAEIDFAGAFIFMPFYNKDEPDLMTVKLKREVAYLRGIIKTSRINRSA